MGAGDFVTIPFVGARDFITVPFVGTFFFFPIGALAEERARSVYHQGPSAKFPLAFFPPVR